MASLIFPCEPYRSIVISLLATTGCLFTRPTAPPRHDVDLPDETLDRGRTDELPDAGEPAFRYELANSRALLLGVAVRTERLGPNGEPVAEDDWSARRSSLEPPILDIRVVNRSHQTQFLHKLHLVAKRTSFQPAWLSCMGMASTPSGDYDVALKLNRTVQVKMVPISHSMTAGGVDRFLVAVAPLGFGTASFEIKASIEMVGGAQSPIEPFRIELDAVPGSCTGKPWRRPGPLRPIDNTKQSKGLVPREALPDMR